MARLLLVLICAANLWSQNVPPKSTGSDVWKPLRFLIGTWEAKTKGGSAGAVSTGTYTFQLELRDRILARHTAGVECKGPADFNCEHSDLLYVYPDAPGGSLRAIFFDNEGHVIHYDVSIPADNSVVFSSDPTRAGPQYQLSYRLVDGEMSGKFAIRMPGRAEFTPYLEWSGAKK